MSSTRCPNPINAFAIDAFCASMELNAVSERDAPGMRAAAIRKGLRTYRVLLQRRDALCLSGDDGSTTEDILKTIQARLEYLCSVSTFRRNQWRWRREEAGMPEAVDIQWLWKGSSRMTAERLHLAYRRGAR